MDFNLFNGDCLDVLKTLPDNSVDSIVTDPPYGLSNQSQDDIVKCLTAWLADEAYTHGKSGFMGKKWDSFVPSPTVWKECLRVLKHGGHIACFAGSRTQDLMGISLRLAGFEMRDTIMWVYFSGFPKGLDIAKGIDKHLGVSFDTVPASGVGFMNPSQADGYNITKNKMVRVGQQADQAKQWEGWNTNLKPSYEPIILARKPLDGTVVNNVLKHGVGGLNVGACRVEIDSTDDIYKKNPHTIHKQSNIEFTSTSPDFVYKIPQGRYPANLIHDGSEEAIGGMPNTNARKASKWHFNKGADSTVSFTRGIKNRHDYNAINETEGGSASRYFYCAKASKADRDEGVNGMNPHPTIKPTALMRYVTKLITPLNGTVLDPFMGSGSTGKACMLEDFNFTGIELSSEYLAIAEARIKDAQSLASRKQLKLPV